MIAIARKVITLDVKDLPAMDAGGHCGHHRGVGGGEVFFPAGRMIGQLDEENARGDGAAGSSLPGSLWLRMRRRGCPGKE